MTSDLRVINATNFMEGDCLTVGGKTHKVVEVNHHDQLLTVTPWGTRERFDRWQKRLRKQAADMMRELADYMSGDE